MADTRQNLKRKFEIFAFCLSNSRDIIHKVSDLAEMFNVEPLTIKRDLQTLRFEGIDIHSSPARGVYVQIMPSTEIIQSMMLQYLGICYPHNLYDKATSLLIQKFELSALSLVVSLQHCIDERLIARIKYNSYDDETEERDILPLMIFHSDKSWRILSQDKDSVKQFHIERISSIKITKKKFIRMDEDKFIDLFKYSWKSWISSDKFNVKLLLSPKWKDRYHERSLSIDLKKTEQPDGSIIFEFTVNSLNEVAAWITSRGSGFKVLEPPQLKEMVIQIAKDTINNYK